MTVRRIPFALLGLAAAALLLVLAPAASAHSRDRNHDRIPDKWETTHHLSLKVNQAGRDQDRDGLKNLAEWKAGDDPRKADTNGDGVKDGREDSGTIVSFTNGTLTIKLFRNDKTVEGTVDDQSEIECDDHTASTRSGGDDGPGHDAGDDQGGDNNDQGDNNDDQGENDDQGDDNGGANCTTAQLTPGATVHEARLSTTPDGLHFDKVELGSKATS
jgi:hypothetical protein